MTTGCFLPKYHTQKNIKIKHFFLLNLATPSANLVFECIGFVFFFEKSKSKCLFHTSKQVSVSKIKVTKQECFFVLFCQPLFMNLNKKMVCIIKSA